MEDKNFESFKQKLTGAASTIHIQEVIPTQEIENQKSQKEVYRNKEKISSNTRQLNVEVSESTFIKLKTRSVEERVALRILVEEAVMYYLNRK